MFRNCPPPRHRSRSTLADICSFIGDRLSGFAFPPGIARLAPQITSPGAFYGDSYRPYRKRAKPVIAGGLQFPGDPLPSLPTLSRAFLAVSRLLVSAARCCLSSDGAASWLSFRGCCCLGFACMGLPLYRWPPSVSQISGFAFLVSHPSSFCVVFG